MRARCSYVIIAIAVDLWRFWPVGFFFLSSHALPDPAAGKRTIAFFKFSGGSGFVVCLHGYRRIRQVHAVFV